MGKSGPGHKSVWFWELMTIFSWSRNLAKGGGEPELYLILSGKIILGKIPTKLVPDFFGDQIRDMAKLLIRYDLVMLGMRLNSDFELSLKFLRSRYQRNVGNSLAPVPTAIPM